MEIIRTITEDDFGRQSMPEKYSIYPVRPGARAVLFDNLSKIALMHVSNHNYYKLPGGGIDEGEDVETGLKRELLEEVGASSIEIISEIGEIDEYRDEWEMKAEHYGFIAKLTGEIVEPSRTEKEIAHGHETVWAKNIDEAIALVESGSPTQYGQEFEKLRELTFLKKVKNILSIGLVENL
ncbi:MAG TPA: NUDIX domain-containing protein [Candidatus Saccharibacteria bacterium]|nr:NUDIX domain-containing protein [Candidatus Saccharibacteria bacterium]